MKKEILKHTGLTEKQFYAKYKTPDDFFKSKSGIAFSKAQNGSAPIYNKDSNKNGVPDYMEGFNSPSSSSFSGFKKPPMMANPNYGVNEPTSLDPNSQALMNARNLRNAKQYQNEDLLTAEGLKQGTIGMDEQIAQNEQMIGSTAPSPKGKPKSNFGVVDAMGLAGGAINAGLGLMDEFKRKKEAKMWQGVTSAQLAASKTRPEQYERKWVRPEDQTITGEELFPIYGVGTNPIAQNGSTLSNNFDPYDIYADEGYEPLNDSDNNKQFGMCGDIAGSLSGPANSIAQSYFDNNAGYQMGNTLGQAASFIPGIGPIAGAVAAPLLGAIGGGIDQMFGPAGAIKKAQKATDRNISQMRLAGDVASVQGGFASHMRAGGPLRQNNPNTPPVKMEEGGELQTHWGGYAEPISYNPFLPEGGETVMFRGNSHTEKNKKGDTGIGISYGDKAVEVERGEPGMKLQNGSDSGESDFVVFGNIPIGKQGAELLGDPEAKNKRFKNYISDLSKKEQKATKTLDKSTDAINNLDVIDQFDKLKMASYQANMQGSTMSLKDIATKKQNAAHLQNAINETRNELSQHLGRTISAEDLGRGKVKYDTDPVTKDQAQSGKTIKINKGNVNKAKYTNEPKGMLAFDRIGPEAGPMFASEDAYAKYKESVDKAYADPETAGKLVDYFKNYVGPGWQAVRRAMYNQPDLNAQIKEANRLATDKLPGAYHIDVSPFAQKPAPPAKPVETPEQPMEDFPLEKAKNPWWLGLAGMIPKPKTSFNLDPNQIMGEMYALSHNQVQPVPTQSVTPELNVPYDISLQDQLNEITAQTRGAQRMAGYNPAAQAAIAGQAYEPANRVLGEQFRLNQAEKDRVYSGNRNTMNQFRMANAGLYADQQDKMAQAVANTEAINQAALSNISDKYQQNKLAEKRLQTMEELYNYRFGPKMRAYSVNSPHFFDTHPDEVYSEIEDGGSTTPPEFGIVGRAKKEAAKDEKEAKKSKTAV